MSDPAALSTSQQAKFVVERLEAKLGKYDQDLVDLRALLGDEFGGFHSDDDLEEAQENAYDDGNATGREIAISKIKDTLKEVESKDKKTVLSAIKAKIQELE